MLGYYTELALRSLRRSPILTALMVLAIGLGIGASMTMLTVLHVMTADPVPGKSARLFYPQLDPRDSEGYQPGQESLELQTWLDAINLLHARRGSAQVAMTGGRVTVRPPQGSGRASFASARYASADFFTMFDVPFAYGHGWSAGDDEKQARVVVLARPLADKLFGAERAVGQTLHLGEEAFRVIGVIDRWNPVPHYYDLSYGAYAHSEEVFLPLETAMGLKFATQGSMYCWGGMDAMPSDKRLLNNCAWMQFWVQLDTPKAVADYRAFLVHYSHEQKTLGRFQRPPNVALHDVMGWLAVNHVVPGGVQLQALLALGFLLVCLVNTVALLLVKFLRRGSELSVRRAMGASQRSVFAQLLIEASMIGFGGGALGLLLACGGLWIVRQQPAQYAPLAQLDASMLANTLVLALVATLLAAIFPAWRACRLPPARALKIQ